MSDPRIPLKNPVLAAVLAYLIPGAGHLYQGRIFKGLLYSFGILGTFLYGLALGEWQVVYARSEPGGRHLGYGSQVLVGLPALPALVQSRRYRDPDNVRQFPMREPLEASFEGVFIEYQPAAREPAPSVEGTVQLNLEPGPLGAEVRGVFTGTRDGRRDELTLAGPVELERPVRADPRRRLVANVLDDRGRTIGRLEGTIPRRFANWFQVPPDDEALRRLHGDLGKLFELAMVFTWIAGLLNILAVWDALEGPAYGYGDEEPSQEGQPEETKQTAPPPQPAAGEPPPRPPDTGSPAS